MQYLRQSTAGQVRKLPKQLDSTDGNTPETGLTIANTDIRIWKHGATASVSKNSGGATHVSIGDYYTTYNASDTDTLGSLAVETHVSGALYTRSLYTVLPAVVYDALIAGSDNLQIDLVQIAGVAVNTASAQLGVNAVSVTDKTGFSLSSAGVTAIQSGLSTLTASDVWNYATRTLSSISALVSGIADAVWTRSERLLSAFGFTVSRVTLVDTCTTNTDMRGTNDAYTGTPPTVSQIRAEIDNSTQLAAIIANIAALNNISTAQVLTQVASALNTYNPPTKAELDAATTLLANYIDTEIADIKIATDKLNSMIQADGTDQQFKAVALELAPGGGSGGSATLEKQEEILTAVAGVITHGDSNWLTPSGIGGTIAVTFNIKDDSELNVLDAVVEVWDTAGTTLKERKETDSSGNAVFNMKAETYTIKITKSGYSCDNKSYTVSAPATVNYVMTAFVIPAPTNPAVCRIWADLSNPKIGAFTTLSPIAEVTEYISDNNFVTGRSNGEYDNIKRRVFWDVARGASAVLKISEINFEKTIDLVPDAETARLEDLTKGE